MSGKARIGSTVIGSSRSKSDRRVLHVSRGRPLTSALHEPHLAALQFQRTARSGRLVALDPVEGVEDDHPLLDRHVELVEPALLVGAAAEDSQVGVWHRSSAVSGRSAEQAAQLVGHRRGVASSPRTSRRRAAGDDAVDAAPAWLVGRRDGRAGCGRRGSRSAGRALRAMASETVSRLSSSKTRFQPGL